MIGELAFFLVLVIIVAFIIVAWVLGELIHDLLHEVRAHRETVSDMAYMVKQAIDSKYIPLPNDANTKQIAQTLRDIHASKVHF